MAKKLSAEIVGRLVNNSRQQRSRPCLAHQINRTDQIDQTNPVDSPLLQTIQARSGYRSLMTGRSRQEAMNGLQ
jgi:hypothetical protein